MQQMPEELAGHTAFARFDVDPPEHLQICRDHRVLNVPFVAFYRDSLLIPTVTGLREADVIVRFLQELVNQPD
jgi:hypothetical protein